MMNNNNDKDVLLNKDGSECNLSNNKEKQNTLSIDTNNMQVDLILKSDTGSIIENNQDIKKTDYEINKFNIVDHDSFLINNFLSSSRNNTLNLNASGQKCKNISNTCWLSSLLQCMIHSNTMLDYMSKTLTKLTSPLVYGITKTMFEYI